jgi:hypothetical protein
MESTERKKRKSTKERYLLLLEKDEDILAALYRHRLLSNQLIYELLFEGRSTYKLNSLIHRMNKLESHGYVNSIWMQFPKRKGGRIANAVKGYMLTELGVQIVIGRLDYLDYNLIGPNGETWRKGHLTSEELRVTKQIDHHYQTQTVVVKTIRKIIDRIPLKDMDFLSVEHGGSREYTLDWKEYDEELVEKERKIWPDWVFTKVVIHNKEPKRKVIAIEEDMSTMRASHLSNKLHAYLQHIMQNADEYRFNPLHLVFSVDDQNDSLLKRLRNIKELCFEKLESVMYPDHVRVFVLGNKNTPSVIADLYDGVQMKIGKDSLPHFIQPQKTNYNFKESRGQDYFYDYPGMWTIPDGSVVYQRPNGDRLEVFLVQMGMGSVNGQAKLINLQETILKNNLNGLAIGIYSDLEEIQQDVFIESRQGQRFIHMGQDVILSTIDELRQGRAYQVSVGIDRNNKQRLRMVTYEDVIH